VSATRLCDDDIALDDDDDDVQLEYINPQMKGFVDGDDLGSDDDDDDGSWEDLDDDEEEEDDLGLNDDKDQN